MVMSVILVVFLFLSIIVVDGLSWCTRKCLVSLFTATVSVGAATTRADVMTTVLPGLRCSFD